MIASDAWITDRVGIRTRYSSLPLDYIRETKNRDLAAAVEAAEFSIADMGAQAAERAFLSAVTIDEAADVPPLMHERVV